jgi:hypothetical protein
MRSVSSFVLLISIKGISSISHSEIVSLTKNPNLTEDDIYSFYRSLVHNLKTAGF